MAWEVSVLSSRRHDLHVLTRVWVKLRALQVRHGEVRARRQYSEGPYRPFDLLRPDGEVEDARCAARGLPHLQRKVGCCDGHVPSSCKLLRAVETPGSSRTAVLIYLCTVLP